MQIWQFKTKLQGLPGTLLFACYERKNKRSNAVCRTTHNISSSGNGIATFADAKGNKYEFNINN